MGDMPTDPLGPQRDDLFRGDEGPCRGDLAGEGMRRQSATITLSLDRRGVTVIEMVFEDRMTVGRGRRFDETAVLFDANRTIDDQPLAGGTLQHHADRTEGIDERARRTVHTGKLFAVDLNDAIIDLQPVQRRHHMFDHGEAGRTLAKSGPERTGNDRRGANVAGRSAGEVRTNEPDPASGRGRGEADMDLPAAPITTAANFAGRGDRMFIARTNHREGS